MSLSFEESYRQLPELTFALQALLARHEALMASAENERHEMQSRIDQLEMDKMSLEATNARTTQDNHTLLDKLEKLHECVADSETQIKALEANFRSLQRCAREMERAEVRAAQLEGQVHLLETEQAELQENLVTTQAEARSAMSRWHRAEKGITSLQEKLGIIEKGAREEQERHTEMVIRMKKQRAMKKDANAAAGRLEGAAAARNLDDGKNGAVILQFVRDLLSDNENLQLGIAELRELLVKSNDETQHLREQLMFYQPVGDGDARVFSTLRAELEPEETSSRGPVSPQSPLPYEQTRSICQELHVHHHYSVATPNEPTKPLNKRRQGLSPNAYLTLLPLSPPGSASPAQRRLQHRATSPALVEHSVKDSISTIPSSRWSVFSDQPSDFVPSSAPSSPMSHRPKVPLIYWDGDDAPISPSSTAPLSSLRTREHRPQTLNVAMRKFSTPQPLYPGDVPEYGLHEESPVSPKQTRRPKYARHSRSTRPDCTPDLLSSAKSLNDTVYTSTGPAITTPLTTSFDEIYTRSPRPRLRRTASHDSIMCLSGGVDVLTLKDRPDQLALRPIGNISAETKLSVVVAKPTLATWNTGNRRGSIVLRDNLLSLPNLRASSSLQAPRTTSASSLSRFVSWRPWGVKENYGSIAESDQETEHYGTTAPHAPTEDDESATSKPATPFVTESTGIELTMSGIPETVTKKECPPTERVLSPRNFGINQSGTIPGFSAYWVAHQMKGPCTQVVPQSVDIEALRDSLQDSQRPL